MFLWGRGSLFHLVVPFLVIPHYIPFFLFSFFHLFIFSSFSFSF
jgi:hypothetical protein